MFKSVTIKTRLIFVIGFLAVELVAGFAIGILNLDRANQLLVDMFDNRLVPVTQLLQMERVVLENQVLVARAAQPGADIAALLAHADRNTTQANQVWVDYMQSTLTPTERTLAERFANARVAFIDGALKPTRAALQSGDQAAAQALINGPMTQLAAPVSERLAELVSLQIEVAGASHNASAATAQTVRMVCFAGLVAGLLFALALGWTLVRGIVRPLEEAMRIAGAVAKGDLTQTIVVRSQDETGRLMGALKEMNDALVGIVSRVRAGTDTIATASSEIADGNLDLSSRTEQQASALEETASSMEELTSTVKQNADNARQANVLAGSASDIAGKGGAVVAQVVQTMSEIHRSSSKIVEIIAVIDGIAFQTNILALNAAVEAARAGEQGRGFAVVAGEVRNLAQRSAAAAREIKGLIDDSVRKVDHGSALVDQAGATMQEIVDSVNRVTDIMAEISAASQEQNAGIEQVNAAIIQMDQTTQQNAALVEQASAAAQSLQQESASLAHTVDAFQIAATAAPLAVPLAVSSAARARQLASASAALMPASPVKRRPATPTPTSTSTSTSTSTRSSSAQRAVKMTASAGDGWEEF